MPAFTAQSPAWLPSQQRLTRAIDGATAAPPSSPETAAPSKAPRRTISKQAAFLNFVLVCQKPTPATAAKDVPAKTAKPRDADADGVGRKASPWSLPPSSLNRLSDPVLDGSTASPRWDGWSFKRQGRTARATAKVAAEDPPLDTEAGAEDVGASGAGEHTSDGTDAAACEDKGLAASDADSDNEAEDDEDDEDEDEDMFVMEADAAVDVAMGRGRSSSSAPVTSASELAALCEYSMVRAASHLTQLGLHRIKFPGAVFA